MGKNLVICCDGTNNEIKTDLSNVLKMYRILPRGDNQVVFYDPGIGTIGNLNLWTRFKQKFLHVFGMATGYGLDENILEAYNFLIDYYEEGDRVFLFGFSRGAYTVRALAGFLCTVGLLQKEQKTLCAYALNSYKTVNIDGNFKGVQRFQSVTNARKIPIQFVGVWDTVSSVLVPRPDRFYIPSTQRLPYTAKNPHVQVFRQAAAIDERRRMFRLNRWVEPQNHKMNPFSKQETEIAQDVKQVWFSGVHADVGGGYAEEESALAKYPLGWMIQEAQKFGLHINQPMFDHLVRGKVLPGGRYKYVGPSANGVVHKSLSKAWWLLEMIPKWTRYPENPHTGKELFGYKVYFPFGERRYIAPGSYIHSTVFERMEATSTYRPSNIPKEYKIENNSI